MNKKILPLCALLVLGAGLAACGETPAENKKVKMTLWIANDNVSWAQERAAAFKEEFKDEANYEVSVTAVAEGDALTQIEKDPDAAADVFHFAGDHLGTLVRAGYIKDIANEVADALVDDYSFSISAINSGKYEGKFYGVPFTPNSYFMYYNTSKVNATDILSLDALLEKGKVIFDIDNGWYQTAFWYGTGVRFFGPSGSDPIESNLNTELGYAAGRAINKYINHPNFINGGDDEIKAQFKSNSDYVAAIGGAWLSADLIANLGDDIGATILPTFTEGTTSYPMMATGDWKKIGVSRFSAVPDHATRLALWMANAESQRQRCERFNDAPVIGEVLSEDEVKDNIFVAALGRQTQENVVRQPSIPQMQKWWSAAEAFANDMIDQTGIWTNDEIIDRVNLLNDQLLATA